MPRLILSCAAIVFLFLVSACKDADDIEAEGGTSEGPLYNSQVYVDYDVPPPDSANDISPERINIRLIDYEIVMADTLVAGPNLFVIYNDGTVLHTLRLEGPGLSARLEDEITPQDQMWMQLYLRPGTYEVICPVDDHGERDMRTQFTVVDPGMQ